MVSILSNIFCQKNDVFFGKNWDFPRLFCWCLFGLLWAVQCSKHVPKTVPFSEKFSEVFWIGLNFSVSQFFLIKRIYRKIQKFIKVISSVKNGTECLMTCYSITKVQQNRYFLKCYIFKIKNAIAHFLKFSSHNGLNLRLSVVKYRKKQVPKNVSFQSLFSSNTSLRKLEIVYCL